MLEVETIKKILGIRGKVDLNPEEMAKNLKITFFPYEKNTDEDVLKFGKKLESAFNNLGVQVVPYNEALEFTSFNKIFRRFFIYFKLYLLVAESLNSLDKIAQFKKSHYKNFFRFIFGKKIKRKIAIVALGEGKEGNLPMDYTTSFKENPIITVVKKMKK